MQTKGVLMKETDFNGTVETRRATVVPQNKLVILKI
jgi:hypothetical protein